MLNIKDIFKNGIQLAECVQILTASLNGHYSRHINCEHCNHLN